MTSTRTAIVWSCGHADPSVNNERYNWLGQLIYDIKPDYCIDLGDGADMRSLNSYDTKYPKAIVSQSYEADVDCYNDSQERLRWKFRYAKRKRPFWVGFEGNHEHRIKTAIKHDPRLEGQRYGVSFSHLQTKTHFDEYHEYQYSAPSIADYDDVSYAHFFSSGNYGTAISGIHHAYTILGKRHRSSTCGHSHKRSMYFEDGAHPNGLISAVVGCYKGASEGWAGQANKDWWPGVLIKRNIKDGMYDPEWISLAALEKEYGGRTS
jgi:hypothetical protein